MAHHVIVWSREFYEKGVKHTTPNPNTMRPGEVQVVQKFALMGHFVRVTPSLRIQNSHENAYWGTFS